MLDIDLLIDSDGLFMTTLPSGESFVWRLLTLKEYRVFSSLRNGGLLSEIQLFSQVFDRCVVGDPRAIDGQLPAGIFLAIGELIMYLSGDNAGDEREEIETARALYNNGSVTEVMKRVVLIAFPYKPEELEHWTRKRLVETFTLAEALLVNKGGYEFMDTSQIMTAEQAAAKANKPVVDFRRENQELSGEFGDRKHALDRHPAELAKKAKKTQQLKKEQLRNLDRIDQEVEKKRKVHRRR